MLDHVRRRALVAALAVFAVAFPVRVANHGSAFANGIPQFSPFDEMYHAKRMAYSAAHPFRILDFDPSRGVHGAFCPWPPLYDLLAGTAAGLVLRGDPVGTLVLASWLPPVFASLAAALAAWALARRFDVSTGVLAGLGVALATSYLDRSRLAAIDHHFLEFPLAAGALLALTAVSRADDAGKAARSAGLFAIALSTALLVQTALLLAAAMSLVAVLLLDRKRHFARLSAAGGFTLAAAILLAYRVLRPAGYPDNEWYLGIPHAAALVAAAAAVVWQAHALRKNTSFVFATSTALAIGGLTLTAFPEAFVSLLGGSLFLGGNPWLESIVEFQPLFFGPDRVWAADLALLGGGVLLTVVSAAARRSQSGSRRVLAAFAIASTAAAIASMRFLSISAPLCAISGALVVHDLVLEGRRALARVAAVVLLLPSVLISAGRVIRPTPPITPGMVPLIRTAEFLRAASAPGRVLGPWSWGHLFNVVGGRPVLVDNFGTASGRTSFENARGIILSPREMAVADFCRWNGVRFVVLQDPLFYYAGHAEASGLPRSAYEGSPRTPGSDPVPTPLMMSTFWWRAYFEGGRARPDLGPAGAPFRAFRLVRVETEPESAKMRTAVQIWERIPRPQ